MLRTLVPWGALLCMLVLAAVGISTPVSAKPTSKSPSPSTLTRSEPEHAAPQRESNEWQRRVNLGAGQDGEPGPALPSAQWRMPRVAYRLALDVSRRPVALVASSAPRAHPGSPRAPPR